MTVVVRAPLMSVKINGLADDRAVTATCSLGFDQRYAEATVTRTGGGTTEIGYWDEVEILIWTTPGDGPATRFSGYVIPVANALYPIENVLHCKGRLYRAAFVRNTAPGGTDLCPPGSGGRSDEQMVTDVLIGCGVSSVPGAIGGTGKALGSLFFDRQQVLTPGPFTWAEGQSGLDFIEALDEVSVPDDASGRYRTFETVDGTIYRIKLATAPAADPDFSFTEGVDVFDARITRDPTSAANRVTVTGAPLPVKTSVGGTDAPVLSSAARWTVTSDFAPYLPPGVPLVAATLSSPMIEKSTRDDPDFPEDVISCQQVAEFLLTEVNTVVDTLEFSTPRADVLGPGQTIHLHSPRLGITDPGQHYWLQHLDVVLDERGAFTQRLRCVRKS